MEEVKNAVKNLEDAVLDLETAIYGLKKSYQNKTEQTATLKTVIKKTYDTIDGMILTLKKGDE